MTRGVDRLREEIARWSESGETDRLAGVVAYGARKGKMIRGEFASMHILFEPSISSPIREIRPSREILIKVDTIRRDPELRKLAVRFFGNEIAQPIELAAAPTIARAMKLPRGLGRFLCYSNGCMLFAGHLILFGLRPSFGVPADHLVKFRPVQIDTENFVSRHPRLAPHCLHIGSYFYAQRLVFSDLEGRIHLSKPFSGQSDRSWSSFDDYLIDEVNRLAVQFDARGRFLAN